MFEKLVQFVDYQLYCAKEYAETPKRVEHYRSNALGAIQFCVNSQILTYVEIIDWWDTVHDSFDELYLEKARKLEAVKMN